MANDESIEPAGLEAGTAKHSMLWQDENDSYDPYAETRKNSAIYANFFKFQLVGQDQMDGDTDSLLCVNEDLSFISGHIVRVAGPFPSGYCSLFPLAS